MGFDGVNGKLRQTDRRTVYILKVGKPTNSGVIALITDKISLKYRAKISA